MNCQKFPIDFNFQGFLTHLKDFFDKQEPQKKLRRANRQKRQGKTIGLVILQ